MNIVSKNRDARGIASVKPPPEPRLFHVNSTLTVTLPQHTEAKFMIYISNETGPKSLAKLKSYGRIEQLQSEFKTIHIFALHRVA